MSSQVPFQFNYNIKKKNEKTKILKTKFCSFDFITSQIAFKIRFIKSPKKYEEMFFFLFKTILQYQPIPVGGIQPQKYDQVFQGLRNLRLGNVTNSFNMCRTGSSINDVTDLGGRGTRNL